MGRTVTLGLAGQQADFAHGVGCVARQHVAQHAEDGADAPDAAWARHHAQRHVPLLLQRQLVNMSQELLEGWGTVLQHSSAYHVQLHCCPSSHTSDRMQSLLFALL